ncbi:MAG: hypothetical protein K6U80_08825 [Firmicutes bacterium]|nr:hypothetical protein [Bacillota bacterium]
MDGSLLLYLFIALVLINYFFVPKERFGAFFPTAICVALFTEIFAILLFSKAFRLFQYTNLGKYGEDGFPVFIMLGWIVLIILYLHFLPNQKSLWPVLVYTFFFTIMTHFLHELVDINNHMVHYFKGFDFLAIPGNMLRYLAAYWLQKSGFFNQ